MTNEDDREVDDIRSGLRKHLVDQLMFRANMFMSANEQIQTFLFSVHGGGLVAALAFLSSERGKVELSWLPWVIALLISGIVLSGVIRALVYFTTRGLMVSMNASIKGYDQKTLNIEQAIASSLPKTLVFIGNLALALGILNFVLFLLALCITVQHLLLPHL